MKRISTINGRGYCEYEFLENGDLRIETGSNSVISKVYKKADLDAIVNHFKGQTVVMGSALNNPKEDTLQHFLKHNLNLKVNYLSSLAAVFLNEKVVSVVSKPGSIPIVLKFN